MRRLNSNRRGAINRAPTSTILGRLLLKRLPIQFSFRAGSGLALRLRENIVRARDGFLRPERSRCSAADTIQAQAVAIQVPAQLLGRWLGSVSARSYRMPRNRRAVPLS